MGATGNLRLLLPERGDPVGVLISISAKQSDRVHHRSRLLVLRPDSEQLPPPGTGRTPHSNTCLLIGCAAASRTKLQSRDTGRGKCLKICFALLKAGRAVTPLLTNNRESSVEK